MNKLPEWAEIIMRPEEHIRKKVHVEGWNKGAVFILNDYDPTTGIATLEQPVRKHRGMVTTTRRLYKKRSFQ